MNQTQYLCPGSSEYWRIRADAFALIKVIAQDLRVMDVEEEGPYWTALQTARSNETVLEILRAQNREALLNPPLGPISKPPRKSKEELVANAFNLTLPLHLPTLLKHAHAEEDYDLIFYIESLDRPESEFAPWVQRIMTPEGIVRIETEDWDDEESRFYRRESYLNGLLHDHEGRPAVKERSYHRIPEEGHLDEDYEESYRLGELVDHVSHDDEVVANWSQGQREAFGASV